jgi:signal transduction histidine kinase
VQGDENRLEEMLANLLSNAIRYSPQGGPITVSVRHLAGDFAEIAVQDQGIGIPREAQAHLAERFYRAENARRVSGQGLGLGLYLVNALAIHHGGHLSVESEGVPGKGSTFRIALPMQQ